MDSSTDLDNDPRGWSIDQVVQELCHSPTPCWSALGQPQLIPDRQLLEDTLRRNHVDGDNLLALDMTTLKDDLSITSFGQRRSIIKAVEYLRNHSRSYQQMVFQADSIARMQSATYVSPQITQSRISLVPQPPGLLGIGIQPSVESRQHTRSPSMHSAIGQGVRAVNPQGFTLLNSVGLSPPDHPFNPPASALDSSVVQRTLPLPHVGNPNIAPSVQKAQNTPNDDQPFKTSEESARLLERPRKEYNVVDGKKKVKPTLVSQLPEASAVNTAYGTYLSPNAVPVQDIFYYKVSTDFGDTFYRVANEESDNFSFACQSPRGQSRLVAKYFRFFLRQGTFRLPRSGSQAKLPYKNSGRQSEQYFTLFPRNNARPRVHIVEDFPDLKAMLQGQVPKSGTALSRSAHGPTLDDPLAAGEEDRSNWTYFDYIVDKYPVLQMDDVLPKYGDSGDEDDFDEETLKEIEEEEAERSRESTNMTRAEVDATIDETIEEMKKEWRQTKFPKIQWKAYRMWMNAAKNKSRQEEIARANHWKDRYAKMKNKIRLALTDEVWRNPDDLKKQCQSIELAVFHYEEHDYYYEMILRDTPPERPSREALKNKHEKEPQALEEGEELIESDSEPITEDEDDFVVEDSSDTQTGSIHHEPDMEWNPQIPEAPRHPKPNIVVDSISNAQEQQVTRYLAISDVQAEDADVESSSEDDIITPTRRKRKPVLPHVSPTKIEVVMPALTPTPKRTLVRPAKLSTGRVSCSDTSDLDRPARLPKSRYRRQGQSSTAPVDLTLSSPLGPSDETSDFSVHTPELNPIKYETPKKQENRPGLSQSPDALAQDDTGLPSLTDVQGLRETDWSEIEFLDKRRALAKAVYGLEWDAVNDLASFLSTLRTFNERTDVVVNGLLALDADNFVIDGIKAKYQSSAQLLVLLYVTYACGQNVLDHLKLSQAHRDNAFEDKDTALGPFYELLGHVMHVFFQGSKPAGSRQNSKKRKRNQEPLSDLEILDEPDLQMTDDLSTDHLEDVPHSSHKKRKRKVMESQEAKSVQISDQMRIQEQEKRRKLMAEKLGQMQMDGIAVQPVNTTEPYVHLDPHIAQRIKPHQLDGIQFMWREIVEDPKHQGCILAHTMGLGKTMQVISLLVTISLCNQNDDPRIRGYIPVHLRENKTLILCPSALLENWYDELMMWTPHQGVLGQIFKLDKAKKAILRDWSTRGGVLLVSYRRFMLLIDKSRTKGESKDKDVEKILLEEPNLVVADEAHMLKNARSKTGHFAKEFKTTSRIALTGSPLNNHLEEYHTMVDWIAPGYLGDIVQFRSKYSEPINEGLYADSSAYEKRLSLRKLHVLKRDLDPKINRADITAVEKDMPTKTEYFITLPLTDLQKQAYDIYVKYMLRIVSETPRSRNTRIWDWINILGWICHHPSCFLEKLKDRESKRQHSREEAATDIDETLEDASTPDAIAADAQLDNEGFMGEALRQVEQVLDKIDPGAREDPALSYRTLAVQNIVSQANAVGDKTLIFTHSIPTLNYLEKMLVHMKCKFARIEGKTNVTARQAMTKEFNQEDSYQVFLISMKAGGLGLNLQGASRVIIFDFSFNPSWEQQAIGRAFRLNQKRPVFVYRFQAGGTFEDVLLDKSIFKTQLFGRVVDQKKPTRHASKTSTDYLFPVKDVAREDFTDCLGKDPKVLDTIIGRVDIRKIVLTETFQKEEDEQLNDEEQKAAEEEFRDQRLQREDPTAWQAKQAAQAWKQQQSMYPASTMAPSTPTRHQPPYSTAPSFKVWSNPDAAKSSPVPPPFARRDLDHPRPPQPLQSIGTVLPGSYDDTFQDFPQQPSLPRRAASMDPDVPMS